MEILAAFDTAVQEEQCSQAGKRILPMGQLERFCRNHAAKIGIITVPAASAQSVCDRLVENRISAIWCFAPCQLSVPEGIPVQYENMALSLAHLKQRIEV